MENNQPEDLLIIFLVVFVVCSVLAGFLKPKEKDEDKKQK